MLHGELQQRILHRRRTTVAVRHNRRTVLIVLLVMMHHDLVVMQFPSTTTMVMDTTTTTTRSLRHMLLLIVMLLLLLMLLMHHLFRLHDKCSVWAATSAGCRWHGLAVVLHDLIVMLLVMMLLLMVQHWLLIVMIGRQMTGGGAIRQIRCLNVVMRSFFNGRRRWSNDGVIIIIIGADMHLGFQTFNWHVQRLGGGSGARWQCWRLWLNLYGKKTRNYALITI